MKVKTPDVFVVAAVRVVDLAVSKGGAKRSADVGPGHLFGGAGLSLYLSMCLGMN